MKKILLIFYIIVIGLVFTSGYSQSKISTTHSSLEKPYHPSDDAQAKINQLVVQARKEKKYVILQAGGNWCSWCLIFYDFIQKNHTIRTYLSQNYLYYHLNYSNENKNEAIFEKYAPQGSSLGYPFFIVLDEKGKVVWIQESGSLEEGKGYSETKVMNFLKKARHLQSKG